MATKTVVLLSTGGARPHPRASRCRILADIGVRVENAAMPRDAGEGRGEAGGPDRRRAAAGRHGRGGAGRSSPSPSTSCIPAARASTPRTEASTPACASRCRRCWTTARRSAGRRPAGRRRPLPHHERPARRRVLRRHPVPEQRRAPRDRRRRQPRPGAGHHRQLSLCAPGNVDDARTSLDLAHDREPAPTTWSATRHLGGDQHDHAAVLGDREGSIILHVVGRHCPVDLGPMPVAGVATPATLAGNLAARQRRGAVPVHAGERHLARSQGPSRHHRLADEHAHGLPLHGRGRDLPAQQRGDGAGQVLRHAVHPHGRLQRLAVAGRAGRHREGHGHPHPGAERGGLRHHGRPAGQRRPPQLRAGGHRPRHLGDGAAADHARSWSTTTPWPTTSSRRWARVAPSSARRTRGGPCRPASTTTAARSTTWAAPARSTRCWRGRISGSRRSSPQPFEYGAPPDAVRRIKDYVRDHARGKKVAPPEWTE